MPIPEMPAPGEGAPRVPILHQTASGIVLQDGNVLLIRHRNHGKWLQPGGRIEPDEDPAQAAVREVAEETGIDVTVVGEPHFAHPSSRSVPPPFAILDRISHDRSLGPHRCLSFVYVCRPLGGVLRPQLSEVSDARWVPVAAVGDLRPIPDDLPGLIAAAAGWAEGR